MRGASSDRLPLRGEPMDLTSGRSESSHLVMPNDTNPLGTLFGGRAVEWMDIAAGLAAIRLSHKHVVTASIERLDFHVPIRLGQHRPRGGARSSAWAGPRWWSAWTCSGTTPRRGRGSSAPAASSTWWPWTTRGNRRRSSGRARRELEAGRGEPDGRIQSLPTPCYHAP